MGPPTSILEPPGRGGSSILVGMPLSERSLSEWSAFAQSAGADASKPLDRDLLNRFLIVVHNRGEELSAHELKTLVDELDVGPDLARELISFIGPALALLEAYDRATGSGDDDDFDIGPGVLVI